MKKFFFSYSVLPILNVNKRVPRPLIWMYSVGRKDWAHQADIEQVAAIVAGGKHVHGNGDALGAFAVAKFLGDG